MGQLKTAEHPLMAGALDQLAAAKVRRARSSMITSSEASDAPR